MSASRADEYLTIPEGYGTELGGLRWSHGCDAIEYDDGSTLVLSVELTATLEGLFAVPPVPSFAFVLHLLTIMKSGGRRTVREAFWRLHTTTAQAVGTGVARNAGLLIAELCRGLPPYPSPPTWSEVVLALKRRETHGERRPDRVEVPPLACDPVEKRLAERLAQYDDETLRHWLTHGGPPPGAGRELVAAVLTFPQRIAALLTELRTRDRLVGAATLVSALDAALSLPPRRPRPDRVPQGGYADITTHGDPERLLPSQFALDPDEFVRRFAEKELLFFRREEPHQPTASRRWLVLDQGVRTWGSVRLGLTAGIVALLTQNPRAFGDTCLSVTSSPTTFTLADAKAKDLARLLEASDLTAHPGHALKRVLDTGDEDDPPGPRDIVLFTHPWSLGEESVRSAARGLRRTDRLFAVAVADAGRAELAEWTTGGWVTHRRFRVDLTGAEAVRVASDIAKPTTPVAGWAGDVEPVPFPFRSGTVSEVTGPIGFDADGECVVVIGRGGVVHIRRLTDGGAVEVLPRAYRSGALLTTVEAVVGVTGGFVACGVMSRDSVVSAEYVAAHYDLTERIVRLHTLGPVPKKAVAVWYSFPDLHAVAVATPDPHTGYAVDLSTGGRHPTSDPVGSTLTARAVAAWQRACITYPSPARVPVYMGPVVMAPLHGPYLEVNEDRLTLHRGPWTTLRPVSQGDPLAFGAKLFRGELAGDVLAVMMRPAKSVVKLYLLRGPDGAILREFWPSNPTNAFALSRDGTRIARQVSGWEVEVCRTEPGGSVLGMLSPSGFHTHLIFDLAEDRLSIRVGRFQHTFLLNEPTFRHERTTSAAETQTHRPYGYGTTAVAYDHDRFNALVQAGPWLAAFDRWGQVVLLDRAGKLVLALAVRRELAAAWLPDGTGWGAAGLLGAAPHPNAATRIGAALQAAAEGV